MVNAYALRPGWTPLTIVIMVIAFAVAWPLGLVVLAYILWGHKVPEVRQHFEGMRRDWENSRREWCGPQGFGFRSADGFRSGNAAFDDYRAAELKRLEEERRRLDEERREFERYVAELRRARDKEEFDRFMAERAARRRPTAGDTSDAIDL